VSKVKVGTKEFGLAVAARLGQNPEKLKPASYARGSSTPKAAGAGKRKPSKKEMVGVDVLIHWSERDPNKLGEGIKRLSGDGLELHLISNRGQKVWPDGQPETFCVDQWRCRFKATQGTITHQHIISLLGRFAGAGYDFGSVESLVTFNGEAGYTAAQGE